jgi:ComF family protein
VDVEGFCFSCSVHPLVPEAVRAVARYDSVVRAAIHRFKYGKHPSLAPALARLLLEGWQTPLTERLHTADVVIPLPIHRERERERGFNQSALLAEQFCRKAGLPVLHDVLERTVYHQPQVGLDAAQRRQNVQNAFRTRHPAAVAGKNVLLIDDVWTTGSTLNEAASTLLAAGAARVFAYTVAHERLDGTVPAMR